MYNKLNHYIHNYMPGLRQKTLNNEVVGLFIGYSLAPPALGWVAHLLVRLQSLRLQTLRLQSLAPPTWHWVAHFR